MSRALVHVVARFQAAPGKADALQAALRSLIEPTLREPGCVRYELLVNPTDPGDLVFVEEWSDDAALDAHNLTPHLAAAREQAPALLAAPPDVRRYRVLG